MNLLDYTSMIAAIVLVGYILVCGGFGWYVAAAKNREWYEGVTFGLLLGPAGVIALACLPTLEATAAKPTPARDRLRVSREEEDAEKMMRYRERSH